MLKWLKELKKIVAGYDADLRNAHARIAELEKLVGDWLEANEPPTFWRVENTKSISRADMVAAGHLKERA